ncbi:MAG: TIGR02186 family protein [Salaquimonas sp.]|nr:TIGR02186 family protein [Salaquimonas sp.]
MAAGAWQYRAFPALTVHAAALLALACLSVSAAFAQTKSAGNAPPEELQMGLSVDVVPVTSEFSGRNITVFGTIENPDKLAQTLNEYAIAVTITGPEDDTVVRRKERVFGIWMNRASRIYRNVPTFYAVASNRALDSIADAATLREYGIGIDHLSLSLFSTGDQTFISPAPEFAGSLRRIRREESLFTENPAGVVFQGSSLFRATLALPSNVPIGKYTVTGYLFRNGKMLASRSGDFRVERAGFESYLYTLAHIYALWYGVIAVVVALATGWLGSVVFGRK